MHAYFRNHQLYLAEKCKWLDRQTEKNSKRALLKIESFKLILKDGEDHDQIRLVEKLIKDSLLTLINHQTILQREGYFHSNLMN
ncbi:MAG: hypothetical protein ACR2KB_04760 [Chitinophagaceae bacterium]|jgi:uncharacterized protein YabN with tetrapyrrole methylase and pyrophosphatase domain|nr:hypothetical protein [Flavisolibacter sp.]